MALNAQKTLENFMCSIKAKLEAVLDDMRSLLEHRADLYQPYNRVR